MNIDFVYLVEDPPADRVRQLINTLIGHGFHTVPDGSTALKITTTPDAILTLTTYREKFDADINSFSDIIKKFPNLHRV